MDGADKTEQQAQLLAHLKRFPTRQFASDHLDLLKSVIEVSGLKNGDPRLVTSTPKTQYTLPLTINNRYIASAHRMRVDLEMQTIAWSIAPPGERYQELLETKLSIVRFDNRKESFKPLIGEYTAPPAIVRYRNPAEMLSLLKNAPTLYAAWRQVILAEVSRKKSSPYHKSHNPQAYKLIMDAAFQQELLRQVFGEPESCENYNKFDLLPGEPSDFGKEEAQIAQEGEVIRSMSNRYNRSQKARNACISSQGTNCSVCGMNFEAEYGPLGKGFIQVHHLNPLAQQGGIAQDVDPELDLVPICPNCHVMIHRFLAEGLISPDRSGLEMFKKEITYHSNR